MYTKIHIDVSLNPEAFSSLKPRVSSWAWTLASTSSKLQSPHKAIRLRAKGLGFRV